ncbi:hypothetical protein [Streptomyces varsoviensis]|uniref:Secreted protein n=1 Tax=Streptomyces varsoviensis TaxID=67373 RepID=A0ABR5IVP9_9ACTN|nr:hypothetical protein [Streptomyces varsoviensis]KOG85214.1 hypothetical protein ADK38_37990 [Streptomyces varsoviensis]
MLTTKHMAITGSAALVLTGVLGATAPAHAAPEPSTSAHVAAGGTAPACIDRSGVRNNAGGGIAGWVYNGCGKKMRVKVVVHNWRDTSCQTIPNKQSKYFHTNGGRYDRTAVC